MQLLLRHCGISCLVKHSTAVTQLKATLCKKTSRRPFLISAHRFAATKKYRASADNGQASCQKTRFLFCH